MESVFRRGLVFFRWGSWLWIAGVLAVYWDNDYYRHRTSALLLIMLALATTVFATTLISSGTDFRDRRRSAVIELGVALAIFTLDGWVRREGIVFENGPTLGSWWPVIVLVSIATYLPIWAAGIVGAVYGVARMFSVWFNGFPPGDLSGAEILSVANVGVYLALLAMTISGLMRLLRNAESEVSLARARSEVARTLHDGVLQTLAVVERRSDDNLLKQLARDQGVELRRFLFQQDAPRESEEIGGALMKAAKRYEDTFGGRVNTVIAPDLAPLSERSKAAVLGAASEALTNAGKHGHAKSVTVYLEPGDTGNGLFCSIKDDGDGFDVDHVVESVGLSSSIKGRITEAGGKVEIKSRTGNGTEVLIWLP